MGDTEISGSNDNRLPAMVHSQWHLMQAVSKGKITVAEMNEIIYRRGSTDINLNQPGALNPGSKRISKEFADDLWSHFNRDGILIIDEPENYLHPAFMDFERQNNVEPEDMYGKMDEHINRSSLLIPTQTIIGSDEYALLLQMISREPTFMKKLEPRKFEELIAELLKRIGYEVLLSKQTRDEGYDILAIDHRPLGPYKIGVQCKRYTEKKVGVNIIREIIGVKMLKHFNQAMIVTSSSFSRDAYMLIKNLESQILLKDHHDITNWCTEYGQDLAYKKWHQ